MISKLYFDLSMISVQKLSEFVSELERLNVLKNGEIVCDSSKDEEVLNLLSKYNIHH